MKKLLLLLLRWPSLLCRAGVQRPGAKKAPVSPHETVTAALAGRLSLSLTAARI